MSRPPIDYLNHSRFQPLTTHLTITLNPWSQDDVALSYAGLRVFRGLAIDRADHPSSWVWTKNLQIAKFGANGKVHADFYPSAC